MKYTITRETLMALAKVRSFQVKQNRAAMEAEIAQLPPDAGPWEAEGIKRIYKHKLVPAWGFVRMVNGSTIETALPVRRIAEWAKLTANTLAGEMNFTIEAHISGPSEWRGLALKLGGSSVVFNGWDKVPLNVGSKWNHDLGTPAQWLGDPITLSAPAEGGEFVLS